MASTTLSVPMSAPRATNPWLLAVTVPLAAFMEFLDTTIVNVAVVHIAGNLSASIDETSYVLTSYLVANVIVLPLSGYLSGLLGRKNYYLWSVVIFTISSFLCGLAPSLYWLVFFRVLQGLSGGGLLTASQAILADTFPAKDLGKGMAVYGVAVIVAPVLGPLVGGWITDNLNWRWIFFINLPVGIFAAVLITTFIKDPPHFKRVDLSKGLHLDYIGISFLSVGIAALQCVLDRGQEVDWFSSPFITAASIISVVSIIVAVIWELRVKDPVVDLRLLKDSNTSIASLLIFVTGFVIYGSSAILPMLMQYLLGYNATWAGMALAPGGLACAIVFPIIGILIAKGHLRWYVAVGMCLTAYSMYMMEKTSLDVDFNYMVISRVVGAAGFSMIMLPSMVASYAFVPASKNDAISGIPNLARNMGGSVGIAILTVILDRRSQYHQSILVSHMSPYDPQYTGMLSAATHSLNNVVGAANAPSVAKGLLYMQVQQQGAMLAYIDGFHFMTVICLVCIPLALMLRSPKHSKDVKIESAGYHAF